MTIFAGDSRFCYGRTVHEGTPTSIRHWQLRDLVSFGPCPDGDQVYAVYDTCVMSYPTPTARQLHERQQQQASSSNGGDPHVVAATAASSPRPRIVMNVDFYASCMTYWGGFLAAGGQQGELEVRDLRMDNDSPELLYRGLPEGNVNNALHIARSVSGGVKMFVCNNDSTIKVYSLPDMHRLSTIRTHVPANYASLSPDGRMLCTVGDCTNGTLYMVRETGYEQCGTFEEALDSGMGCCWSSGGDCVAASFQDGTVLVYDHRGGKTIHKYHLNGASRCVKFSPAPLDLLAFTEHEDYAHVVDMRRMDVTQVLSVSTTALAEDAAAAGAGGGPQGGAGGGGGRGGGGSFGSLLLPSLLAAQMEAAPPPRPSDTVALVARSPSLASLFRQRQGTATGWSRDLVHAEAAALAVRLASGSGGGAAPNYLQSVGAGGRRQPTHSIRMYHAGMDAAAPAGSSRGGMDIAGLCWSSSGARLVLGTKHALVTFETDRGARRQFGCGELV